MSSPDPSTSKRPVADDRGAEASARAAAMARFTSGSTLRHVAVMAATGWIGLVSIFAVDFLNLLYISKLSRSDLTAAIGFAGALIFLLISTGIGISIAGTALVSRAVGGRRIEDARRLAASSCVLGVAALTLPAILLFVFAEPLLSGLGAAGTTREISASYLRICLIGTPLMGLGMVLAGILRAVGDARRSMTVTLIGAIATAILDPVFIFGFGLGVNGAALVFVLTRIVFVGVGLHGVVRVHRMMAMPRLADIRRDWRAMAAIATPAVLTNLATPVSAAFITSTVSRYGDAAVAGWAVVDRLVPLAFGGIFALSGAIGPILGQNLGAGLHHRLRRAVTESLVLTVGYCMAVWAVLALVAVPLADQFGLHDDGRVVFVFFGHWASGAFVFVGLLFVANSVFNNLGAPFLSTAFNWGRATLGTIPFVTVGGTMGGVIGMMIGSSIGNAIFGLAAVVACYAHLARLERRAATAAPISPRPEAAPAPAPAP